jgi:lysophospholipase L1-like esterase
MALLLSLELGCRIYFTVKYRSPHFLAFGFENRKATEKKEKIVVYDSVKHQTVSLPGDVVYYKSVPGIYDQRYGFKDFKVSINRLGFRGKEFDAEKPAGVYRIFCLGGSTTEGLEVEDGKDYPSVLEKELNSTALSMKAEAINAGYMGSSSRILLDLLRNEVIKYTPDMIVFCEAFNDYHGIDEIGPVARIFRSVPRLLTFLYNKCLLFAIVLEKRGLYSKKVYNKALMDKLLADYSDNTRKMVSFAQGKGVAIILIEQGSYIKGYDMSFGKGLVQAIGKKIGSGVPVTRDEAYYYMHAATRDIIESIGTDMSVPVVDFHRALSRYPPDEVFYDTAHLTEKGNEVIAGELAKEVRGHIQNTRSTGK